MVHCPVPSDRRLLFGHPRAQAHGIASDTPEPHHNRVNVEIFQVLGDWNTIMTATPSRRLSIVLPQVTSPRLAPNAIHPIPFHLMQDNPSVDHPERSRVVPSPAQPSPATQGSR